MREAVEVEVKVGEEVEVEVGEERKWAKERK
jgi:hypothetical protein